MMSEDQDEMDETFRQHKNYFQHFLEPTEENRFGQYGEKIRILLTNTSKNRLVVDLNDLRAYDAQFEDKSNMSNSNNSDNSNHINIVTRLLQSPTTFIPPFEDAINEHVLNYDQTYGQNGSDDPTDFTKEKQNANLTSSHTQQPFTIGFEGSLGSNQVTPRGLLANLLCQMVAVIGIVTKVSPVRPKVVKSVHYCPETKKSTSREYRDGTSLKGLPTPTVYPTKDDDGNLLETEFGLCIYKDYQLITVQEAPETAPLGQLPRSIDVICENDLVDKCKPGDRIQCIGMYRAMSGKTSAEKTSLFRTLLIANNVQVLGKEIQGIVMTTTDLFNIRELGKRSDIFTLLGKSIAPSIFGHDIIKQSLLLQLLGGVEKNLENGTHLRGDINILMVGDPSTAKSQLLRFIHNIAPLAVNTTGRGSSGVGLTAAVTRDTETGERRLEAGAMVLADRGIVCIDEFDKMSEADRVAIHEVMEQQTVTIAKAGIHATLNARCSVLSAANPVYGQYAKNKKPQENIGLPDSLLSRFDLLFVVLDKLDRGIDRKISEHVLRIHRYEKPGQEGLPISLSSLAASTNCGEGEENEDEDNEDDDDGNETMKVKGTPVWQKYNPALHGKRHGNGDNDNKGGVLGLEFLKKYIYYAKTRFNPVLTDAAIDTISQGYAELRSEQNDRTMPVTARSLETLIRLSAAHAKARLNGRIEEVDAEKALELMKFALYHDTKENENKEIEETEETEFENVNPNEASSNSPARKRMREEETDTLSEPCATTEKTPVVGPNEINKESSVSLLDEIVVILKSLTPDENDENDGVVVAALLAELNISARLRARSGHQIVTVDELKRQLTMMEENNLVCFDKFNDTVVYL